MLQLILYILGGLVLLYFGAEWLIKGGARLGIRFGMTPLVVGLTIIAFGTSAPELAVALKAAFLDSGGIAVGNVVGSNIFNIAFVLGLSVLVKPIAVKLQLVRVDVPILILVSFVSAWMLRDGAIERWEAMILFLGICAYLFLSYKMTRTLPEAEIAEEFESDMPEIRGTILADFGWLFIGLVLLVLGSNWLVVGASGLAQLCGISETVIGLLVVAAGTSLPEVACSLVAAAKGKGDIAVGNVVGSCLFNLLAILGLTGLVQPFHSDDLLIKDLIFMVGLSVFLFPLARTGYSLQRWEGFLLMAIFGIYLALRWPVAG